MKTNKDLIYRQQAIDAINSHFGFNIEEEYGSAVQQVINGLPSAQPEIKPIGYQECANAMMKMWIDNVVTDGEYSRIMDKLNSYWRKNDG